MSKLQKHKCEPLIRFCPICKLTKKQTQLKELVPYVNYLEFLNRELVEALEKAKSVIAHEHKHEPCETDWCVPLEYVKELRELLRRAKGETK